MEWDYEANTTIGLKDEKNWRRVVWVLLTAIMIAGLVILSEKVLGI